MNALCDDVLGSGVFRYSRSASLLVRSGGLSGFLVCWSSVLLSVASGVFWWVLVDLLIPSVILLVSGPSSVPRSPEIGAPVVESVPNRTESDSEVDLELSGIEAH